VAASAAYAAFVRELLSGLGPVRTRAMFGGAGVYLGDAMLGLIADDVLYLRTDAPLAEALAAEGSEPFVHETRGRVVTMPYWRLPAEALDDPDEALAWARRALVPAEAAAAGRSRRRRRRNSP